MSLLLVSVLLPLPASAQPRSDRGADAVERFTVGSETGIGREAEYFPANVLGLPDTTARRDVASVDPHQILSLGLGGEIVLRFDRHVIVDGPGADFTIFENAFHYKIGPRERIYAEPGEVAVSSDGITFTSFPFDSMTLVGCAGVTPTNGDHDPTNPAVSGGDSYDLAALGIDSVRYVRIRDVTAIVKNNRSHPLWDATLNGFDLDAVVAVNVAQPVVAASVDGPAADAVRVDLLPNPASSASQIIVSLDHTADMRARLFDAAGRTVSLLADAVMPTGTHRIAFDIGDLPNGRYLLVVETDGSISRVLPVQLAR